MIIGPLSLVHADKLRTLLDQHGARYSVSYSVEELEQAHMAARKEGPRINPTFQGYGEFLYMDVPREHLLIIKAELERLGLPVRPQEPRPEPELPEYLCPACSYVSHEPGQCPTHGQALVEFSRWVALPSLNRQGRARWMNRTLLTLLLIVFLSAAAIFLMGLRSS